MSHILTILSLCVCRLRNASRATLPGHWPCVSLSSSWPCFLSLSSSSPVTSTWCQTAPTSSLSPTVKPWWRIYPIWRSRMRPGSSSVPNLVRHRQCRHAGLTSPLEGTSPWTPTPCLPAAAMVQATKMLPSAPPPQLHQPHLSHRSRNLNCCWLHTPLWHLSCSTVYFQP